MTCARSNRTSLLVMGVTVIALLAIPTASAQNAAKPDGAADKVIISNMPAHKTRIYALLARVLGKSHGEKLEGTQSEVWSVPQSRLGRVMQSLKQFGCTITHLRPDWNHILKRQESHPVMSSAQEERVDRARSSPAVLSVGVMKAQEAAVSEYALMGSAQTTSASNKSPDAAVSRIILPINDAQNVTIRRVKAVTREKGSAWRGVIEETGENAVLMWWNDGRLSGVLGYKGHIYTIEDMGGHVHAVIEYDPKKMPPDHPTVTSDVPRARGDQAVSAPPPKSAPPAIEPLSEDERRALEAKDITIDLMMLYTKKAASQYICDPADLIELAVEQVNETFRNSGVGNVKLRLIHTQLIDYDETAGDQFVDLYRMVDGDGPFKDVRRLRNEKRADIVGLIVDDPAGCGLSTRVDADSEEAYFVVHHSCATIIMSIAHEVGHILGARHDRSIDPNNSPFAYGHGYVNGTKWRDIMSYGRACDGCLRIPFWSNPRIMYRGEPTGTLAEDNARVILEQAERVSKFR
jgi:hypothetical protein